MSDVKCCEKDYITSFNDIFNSEQYVIIVYTFVETVSPN